jgi:hypothetical protein
LTLLLSYTYKHTYMHTLIPNDTFKIPFEVQVDQNFHDSYVQ